MTVSPRFASLDPGRLARVAHVLRYAERVRRDPSRLLVAKTGASSRDSLLRIPAVALSAIDVTP